MSRYALSVHPDDVATWKDMTGRDETTAPPLGSDAAMEYFLASAERNGVRITNCQKLSEGDDR